MPTPEEEASKALAEAAKANSPSQTDLMALKTKSENLEKELKEAKATWNTTEADYKTKLSAAEKNQFTSEARVTEIQKKLDEASGFKGELDKVRLERDAATNSVKGLSDKALDYRRKLVVATFNISADSVKEKTIEQLDAFEEALKAVQAQQGTKGFAAGGGGAGGGKAQTDLERANKMIEEAYARIGQKVPKD